MTLRVFVSLNVQNCLPHGQKHSGCLRCIGRNDDFVAPLQNARLELGWRTSVRSFRLLERFVLWSVREVASKRRTMLDVHRTYSSEDGPCVDIFWKDVQAGSVNDRRGLISKSTGSCACSAPIPIHHDFASRHDPRIVCAFVFLV